MAGAQRFRLEHVGIAVDDAAGAVELFEKLLGVRPYKVEPVEREGVRTYFLGDGGEPGAAPKLELLEALSADSPVARFLDRRGPGVHHIAFEVEDIEAQMARLAAMGFHLLSEEPSAGADNKRIAFLHPKSTGGVLVELCQSVVPEPVRIAVPFRGGHLAAFVSGPTDAPPLVVLHAALGSTVLEMRRLTRIWERSFRVFALDFMAHGASDPFDDGDLSMEAFVGNVLALMDHADLEETSLFGFSLGGSVAVHAAVHHPERFRRLAIHAHNVCWSQREARLMAGAMESALAEPDGFWARRLAQTHGEEWWPSLVRRMISFTSTLPGQHLPETDLAAIRHPTLVSTGDRDRFFGLRHTLMLHATLPNAALAVLPGVDHAIQTLDSVEFAELVSRHLSAD